MIKITLILFIIAIILKFVLKVMAHNISTEEAVNVYVNKQYPIRIIVASYLWLLDIIATIVCLIITIIQW